MNDEILTFLQDWISQQQMNMQEPVPLDVSLFENGYLDSLAIYRLLFEIQEQLCIRFDMDLVLNEAMPTIEGIAVAIEKSIKYD